MNTEILDIHGNPVRAQIGFNYHGYEVLITTMSKEYPVIGVWQGGTMIDTFPTVEAAINCVNRLTTQMAML